MHPLLTSLLDGYNVCTRAYGQMGSGKSYTTLGPHSEEGPVLPLQCHSDLALVPRATEELFRLISENPSRRAEVGVSIVEVYNSDVFDLLAEDTCTALPGLRCEVLTTKEGRKEGSPLTCVSVCSAQERMTLVGAGLQLRATQATAVHAHSSRSHLIITVTLTTAPCGDSSGVSGVTGSALHETSFINRSGAALADVLGALSELRGHIPYRNSKLTHMLQDVLGGDAKLLVILCVPRQKHVAEMLQSLGFGVHARQAEWGHPAPRKPQ